MFQRENTIKVLVTSNLHVGFAEREPLRSSDSINTFQEVLQAAKAEAVDFVLITGDLFNESRPSRWALHASLDLLRAHCWGSAPVSIECLNDWSMPQKDGSISLHAPNFLDPNINIELPVLVINGFSDDPSGLGNLSELDTLDRAGVVDYCGKVTSSDAVHIPPLLLRKGETLLCLYTLGAVRQELLERLIKEKCVSFSRPLENLDSWFNLFAIHQDRNRTDPHKTNDSIAQIIEPWMDLVVCGRDHESLTEINQHAAGFRYIQPGSTIRTGITADESPRKHMLILEISGKESRIKALPLKTVRPLALDRFVWEGKKLDGTPTVDDKDFHEQLKAAVNKLIARVAMEKVEYPQIPWPPVVQISVETTPDRSVNPIRLGQEFHDVSANPKSMFKVVFKKEKQRWALSNGETESNGISPFASVHSSLLDLDPHSIDDLVLSNLQAQEKEGEFGVLHPRVMMKAMELLLDKDDKQAIQDAYDWEKERVRDHVLAKEGMDADNPSGDMALYHLEHRSQDDEDSFLTHHVEKLTQPPIKLTVRGIKQDVRTEPKSLPSALSVPNPSSGVAPRGRGRAARGRGGHAAKRAKIEKEWDSEEEELNDDIVEIPTTSQGTRRSGRLTIPRGSIVDDEMEEGVDEEEEVVSEASEEFLPTKKGTPSSAGKPGFAIRGGRASTGTGRNSGGAAVYAQVHDGGYNGAHVAAPAAAKAARGRAAAVTAIPTARLAASDPRMVTVVRGGVRGRSAAPAPVQPQNGVVWRIISSSTSASPARAAAPASAARGRGRPTRQAARK